MHLNTGDDGLKRAFKKMYAQLKQGGAVVVVVYHVTIVAIGHGLLKKFWPMVLG